MFNIQKRKCDFCGFLTHFWCEEEIQEDLATLHRWRWLCYRLNDLKFQLDLYKIGCGTPVRRWWKRLRCSHSARASSPFSFGIWCPDCGQMWRDICPCQIGEYGNCYCDPAYIPDRVVFSELPDKHMPADSK